VRYLVVFDACGLYPAPLRDFLLRLALTGLFSAKWTDQIQKEWSRNLLQNRPELKSRLPYTIDLMNQAIPDVLVSGYEPFIELLELPDPDDRHVLAAAIHCGAQAIVTFNLKDFPASELDPYGIEAIHPDVFIENQFDLSPSVVVAAAKEARTSLRKPANTAEQYLETLANQGLIVSSARLREFQELI
jgi:predicted nucleic acid-binding protein